MVDLALQMLARWRPGERILVHQEMMKLTLNVVVRTLFGKDVVGVEHLGEIIHEMFTLFLRPDALLLPRDWPGLTFHRLLNMAEQLNAAMREIIERKKAAGASGNDVVSMLLNARDAVAEGGNIHVTAGEEQDCVVIRVRDDGKGITADMIGRIFEPLVTTKRGQGGTGLGLAISRRIIDATDGEIDVASTPGQGAEFSIKLPRVERPVMSR